MTKAASKITCNTCHRLYIGQTKRSLKLRYQQDIRYIKNNNPQSADTLHILNNRHKYGPMHNTMELLKPINKTKFVIQYEQLYIQSHHITKSCTFSPTTITNSYTFSPTTSQTAIHSVPPHHKQLYIQSHHITNSCTFSPTTITTINS
jgi:sensor c-di-GMP phosphodiesterase-like protein